MNVGITIPIEVGFLRISLNIHFESSFIFKSENEEWTRSQLYESKPLHSHGVLLALSGQVVLLGRN